MTTVDPTRRLVLQLAATAGLSTGVMLTGCAQRSPAPPPPPARPLAGVGVLKIKVWPASGEAVAFAGDSKIQGTGAPGLDALSAIIGSNIPERRAMQAAASRVGFYADLAFGPQLLDALRQRALPVEPLDDFALAAALRDGRPVEAPKQYDALLDVQVNAAGFYPARGAGGHSPMIYAVARLVSTERTNEELMRFGYDADYRESGGERRFVTTPKTISVTGPADLVARATQVREGMEVVAAKMVALIVEDVERRIKNQPALK